MTAGVVTLYPPRGEGSENGLEARPLWSYVMSAGVRGSRPTACGFQVQTFIFLSGGKRCSKTPPPIKLTHACLEADG